MRQSIFIFLILCLCSSAACTRTEHHVLPVSTRNTLTIVLNDVSISTHYMGDLSSGIAALLKQDVLRGDAHLAAIRITAQSLQQQPLYLTLPNLDTLPVHGNRYERARIEAENKGKWSKFNKLLNTTEEQLRSKVFISKAAPWSDINGAFHMALQFAEEADRNGFIVRLIVISDLIQDTEDGDHLSEFIFPANTEVIVLGEPEEVRLKQVLPQNSYRLMPTLILPFIYQNH